MNTLAPLLNREFQKPTDDWYQLAPVGTYPHPESQVEQVIDTEAIQSIVNRFKEDAKRPNFPGLLVDYEHFSYDTDKSSEAAGWILELANRDDGLWGRIKWSSDGEKAVTSGNYRFISPVWLQNDTKKLGGKRVRPLRLDTCGLTNCPNLKGMVPLSNRSGYNQADTQNTNQGTKMNALTAKLGLSADASEDAIVAAVDKLLNRVAALESEAAPLKNRITELESENKKALETQVDADLEAHKNRFKPEDKESWKAILLENRDRGLKLLQSIQEPKPGQAVLNRAAGGIPENGGTAGDVDTNKAEEEIDQYRLANRCSYIDARNAVRMRKPELFGIK